MTGAADLPVGGRRILEALYQLEEGWCMNFRLFERETGCAKAEVRRACRAMKEAGLLFFARGLMDEDGQVAGSGYGLTDVGRAKFSEILASEAKADALSDS